MGFKIGDVVTCIIGGITPLGSELFKGKQYTIMGIHICGCGNTTIDVGIKVGVNSHSICFKCLDNRGVGIWWLSPERFVKDDDELQESISSFMESFKNHSIITEIN